MKNLMIVVIACCLFQGCHDARPKRKYVIENGTDRAIKLEFFRESFYRSGDSIVGVGKIVEGVADDEGTGKALNPTAAFYADSIVATFDNNKRQIYFYDKVDKYMKSKPQVIRNIMINDPYIIENNELYRFVFTEEDYENAEEL